MFIRKRNRNRNVVDRTFLGLILLFCTMAGVVGLLASQAFMDSGASAQAASAGDARSMALAVPPGVSTQDGSASAPGAVDAYAHMAPGTILTATVGSKFTLNLMINSGSNVVIGQQSYMTFTNTLLQVVSTGQPGCVASSSVSPDNTTFDITLQNVVDNGAGEIAYSSGTFGTGPAPGSDFRVAQISLCPTALGDGVIHWQFSPPAPPNRDSKIADNASQTVSNPSLYVDVTIHIVVATSTPTPTSTPTRTPTSTNTPTNTPTRTPTNSPTNTPSNTPTNTPSNTSTNTPTGTITPLPTDTRTNTPSVTNTPTNVPTNTPTNTPSNTPTNTPTLIPTVTNTPTNTPTGTFIPPTATNTPTQTSTNIPTSTFTRTATSLPTGTATSTYTPTQTSTSVSASPTEVVTGTNTPGVPTSTSTTSMPTASPTICVLTFDDVVPAAWFYPYVEWMYCNGIVSGYQGAPPCSAPGNTCFKPGNNTTRGQMSKIVVLAFDFSINTTGGPHFSDVEVGSTFYSYVETAYNLEIVNGYADGTFRPSNNVTRGQLAKIVVNAAIIADPANWTLEDPPDSTFVDVQIGSTFYRWVETATSHGLIVGYPCGDPGEPCIGPSNKPYYRPNASATRAQISKIVYLAATYPPVR